MKITMSEWVEAMSHSAEPDIVPDGFKVTTQIAEEIKKSRSHTGHMLTDMVERGLAEVRNFRVKRGVYLKSVPHYRLKKKGKL